MIILSSVLIFFSGFFCTLIGWKTNFNLMASIETAKDFDEKEKFLDDFIKRDAKLLFFYLIAAVILVIIGLGIIVYVA